jgi:polysaccharide biosynthesis protein PslA
MPLNKKIHIGWYMFSDYLAAAIAWILFTALRQKLLHEFFYEGKRINLNDRILLDLAALPFLWLAFFSLAGSYGSLYKKSRLNEITTTFSCTVVGCTIIFFVIVLNDYNHSLHYYYTTLICFILLHFLFTMAGRWLLLVAAKKQMLSGTVKFNAILAGDYKTSERLYLHTQELLKQSGIYYTGFVSDEKNGLSAHLPHLGKLARLEEIIDQGNIELVVIAIENTNKKEAEDLINRISKKEVDIKIVPSILDILAGSLKTENILSPVLADISTGLIPQWQQNVKRLLDIIVSVTSLIFLSPLLLYIAFIKRAGIICTGTYWL